MGTTFIPPAATLAQSVQPIVAAAQLAATQVPTTPVARPQLPEMREEPLSIDMSPPNGAASPLAHSAASPKESDPPSRPVLAPREASGTQPTPSLRASIGVVVALKKRPATESLAAAEANTATAYSTVKVDGENTTLATPAGVHLVESPPGSTPGRLSNAGYRHLKRINPDLRFVQFLEAGAKLDPQWIDFALKFMERRPEVAVVEGRGEAPPLAPLSAIIAPPPGETQTVGGSFLVRAEAFEAAGGFRGDLQANEIADLCIRMRRRGAHVWRIEERMCVRPPFDNSTWWRDAEGAGYAYAHGYRLHGAPPERLYMKEHLRGIAWGAAVPMFIGALALGAFAFTVVTGSILQAVAVLAGALGLGVAVYGARVAIIAIREGAAKRASWAYGLRVVLGQFGEFFGACRFYLSGIDPRRSAA